MKRWAFKRFRNRLLFYFVGLFVLTLVSIFALVDEVFQRNTETAINKELIVAERIFSQLLQERSANLTRWAQALVSDFAFKRVIATRDHGTLLSALYNLSSRVNADAAFLVATDYKLLADSNHPENAYPTPFFAVDLIEQAEQQGTASALLLIDDQPYQLVVAPVLAPEPIAWLCLGFKIDDVVLKELKQVTQVEIGILSINQAGQRLHASTLMTGSRSMLLTDWRSALGQQSFFESYDNLRYLSRLVVLHNRPDYHIVALLQRSWDEALADFKRLRWLMLLIATTGMVIVLLVSVGLAQTVSKPVQLLVDAVRAIGRGDYRYKVKLSARDELGVLGQAFNEMSEQLAEKEKIRNLLGKVISPVVANELLNSEVQLGGEAREITALFSDLAGFTSLAETLPPDVLVQLINDYLTQMSKQIIAYEGVIDKFIGDAIVAFWGAPITEPNHAKLAVLTALKMQQTLAALRHDWQQQGKPLLKMRIGINTGIAVVGNMGSIDRLDYTMMGDAVNLAARLENANKYYQTEILLSEFTYAQISEQFFCRELDCVRVQGKHQPVTIYELIGEVQTISAATKAYMQQFAEAIADFRAMRWQQAERSFHALASLRTDHVVSLYLARLQQCRQLTVTDDWDGIYDLAK